MAEVATDSSPVTQLCQLVEQLLVCVSVALPFRPEHSTWLKHVSSGQ